MTETPQFLKPEEVSKVLNVTVSQVYTLMRSGELRAVKIGRRGVWRVGKTELDEYIGSLQKAAVDRTKKLRSSK